MFTLVTGGAGYIGSHLVCALLEQGHRVRVVDDLSNGHREALRRVESLTGRTLEFIEGDVADRPLMVPALRGVDVVLHLAAFKAVGESMTAPERYFRNNTGGLAALLEAMVEAGVARLLYSSTAAVYGEGSPMPLTEATPPAPDSAYGASKLLGEEMLRWMARCRGMRAVALRYFNPVGAHPSGRIGEHARTPSNLVPRVLMALTGDLPALTIFGTDYDTPDGTCLRDYIHIQDLVQAHIVALSLLERPGFHLYNVGTGRPSSVREVLAAARRVTGREVPAVEGPRRPGDVPVTVADPARFAAELGFRAERGLDEMVADAWRWWTRNRGGYPA